MAQTNFIEACDQELFALSDAQREKHTAKSEDEGVESIFAGSVCKRLWYSTFPCKLEAEIQHNIIKYKILHTLHYLSHLFMVQKLPALKVKKEFEETIQICWPHNCGNNITVTGELKVGEITLQTLDSKWLDDFLQFFVLPGYENFIKKCQGNMPFLENWTTALPEYDLTPFQPFFFEYDTDESLQIFRVNPQNELVFKYEIKRSFRDILRMRKMVDGVWKEIKFNANYIEGNYGSDTLPQPEMWGIYYRVDKPEIKTKQQKEYDVFEQMITDVIPITRERRRPNKKVTVKLDSGHPCKAITIKAEKSINRVRRNYSNYGSNDDVYSGWSLIKSIPSFKYGPISKFEKLEHYHTSRMLPYWHTPRVPYEEGFNLIPFSSKVDESGFDVGPILTRLGAEISIEIGSTDPRLSTVKIYNRSKIEAENDEVLEDGDENEEDDDKFDEKERNEKDSKKSLNNRFDINIRLIVSKTLVYTKETGDSEYYKLSIKKHQ